MIRFIARHRLIRRGLASAKLRRRLTQWEWVETLRYGGWARSLLLLVVALVMILQFIGAAETVVTERILVGMMIYGLALALIWLNHPQTWKDNTRLLLVAGSLLFQLEVVRWVVANGQAIDPIGPSAWSLLERKTFWSLSIPYALGPMMVSVLLGQRMAIVVTIFSSLLGAMLHGGMDSRFLTVSMLCGFIAALTSRDVRKRSDLIRAGISVGVTTWLLSVLNGTLGPVFWENLGLTNWKMVGWYTVASIGSGIGVAFLLAAILPVIEGVFRITTSITWLELSDLNHPLLKRLTLEAPGTYHHSLMVAHLAEAAAEAIGANAGMVRVCSYFHDIGKLVKPEYFVENARHGRNAHEGLAPTMSALVIIAHVKEGVDLALKHRLNREIIDVIRQHHGTSLVYYFYNRAKKQREEICAKSVGAQEELPEVLEDSFRYPGPRPQTRESAIISLADTIESASRSMEKVTPQKIDQMVDDLVRRRLMEGQLKECDLTLRELEEVAESFKRTLRNMMHSRVAYPKHEEKDGRRRDGVA